MARILITSGPTRQYLDPVRYLTNASSGRMGPRVGRSRDRRGHEVVVVSGPVEVAYPAEARVVPVHLDRRNARLSAREEFPACDGVIGVAAPCDYKPHPKVEEHKIAKTGEPLHVATHRNARHRRDARPRQNRRRHRRNGSSASRSKPTIAASGARHEAAKEEAATSSCSNGPEAMNSR
jgi:phosphopantothenoylcysteine synthetase/decarboxylase